MPTSPTTRRMSSRSRRRARSSIAARPGSSSVASSRSATTVASIGSRVANVIVAVGSTSKVPPVPGLDRIRVWTNREATLARELPRSLLVLGGGPTGCELAQAYARFGVPVTIVQSGDRLMPTDHPRNSAVIADALRDDGVDVRLGRPRRRRARGRRARTARTRSTCPTERPPRATRSCSPSGASSRSTTWGSSATASTRPAARHSRATAGCASRDGLWVIGDPAGPELHTHQAHYQGEVAVRMALGDESARLPGAASRGLHRPRGGVRGDERRAGAGRGIDAVEFVADFATSSRGYERPGQARPRDDRRRPPIAHPRRRGDGLP